jgi:uncharacterized cupin superfamily protein
MTPVKQFVRINANGQDGIGLLPTVHDPSDTPVQGAAHPLAHTAYTDPSGVFTAGVWACDAGTLEIDNLAVDEACYLIEGEVIISDPHGNTDRFVAGEAHGTCPYRSANTTQCFVAEGGLRPRRAGVDLPSGRAMCRIMACR